MYHIIKQYQNKDKLSQVVLMKNTKQQFLLEHNKLSPLNLQATTYLLSRFRIEKASLFKDDNWSIDKLRRPFVLWFTSLTSEEKKSIKRLSPNSRDKI